MATQCVCLAQHLCLQLEDFDLHTVSQAVVVPLNSPAQ